MNTQLQQTLTDKWTLISSTTALLQAQGNQGCFVCRSTTGTPSDSVFGVLIKCFETYTYIPDNSDSFYARAMSLSTTSITVEK